MAKELPYFKFEPNEWDTGNIQMCSMEAQGLFINLCSMYWSRLGELPVKLAKQKQCKGYANALQELTEEELILEENGYFVIQFLDEQLAEFQDTSNKRREAANKRWSKKKDANALQEQSKSNAIREEEKREEEKRESDIDFIYSLYPTKCPYKNVSTGKGSKNKDQIKALLKKHSKDHLEKAIKFYLDDCKKGSTWLKKFKTFLNDIPEVEEGPSESKVLDKYCEEFSISKVDFLKRKHLTEDQFYNRIDFDLNGTYKNTIQTFDSLVRQKVKAYADEV